MNRRSMLGFLGLAPWVPKDFALPPKRGAVYLNNRYYERIVDALRAADLAGGGTIYLSAGVHEAGDLRRYNASIWTPGALRWNHS